MESGSPQRRMEPLLMAENAPASASAAGADGYDAPPLSATTAGVPPGQGVSMGVPVAVAPPEPSYDLSFSVTTNGVPSTEAPMMMMGHQQPSAPQVLFEENGRDPQPHLPSIASYCAYVKYAWMVSKGPFIVIVVNLIVLFLPLMQGERIYYFMLPFDRFGLGMATAATWMATAVWFYRLAKNVDEQVQRYDQMAQYQQGSQNEDASNNHGVMMDSNTFFIPDYENLQGQVSRKLDAMFTRKSAAGNNNNPAATVGSSGTSLLVNWAFSLSSLMLGASFLMLCGILMGATFANEKCDEMVAKGKENSLPLPNSTSGTSDGADFQDIDAFPKDVQTWIKHRRDPWDYPRHYDTDDDYHEDYMVPLFDFPVAYETDDGAFANMDDGTILFGGVSPMDDDDDGDTVRIYTHSATDDLVVSFQSTHTVLVENAPGGDLTYHDDIVNPRMFIPVQNTIVDEQDTSDNGRTPVATQYCWTAASPTKKGKNGGRSSWKNRVRTTPLYCIQADGVGAYNIDKVMIGWTDKSIQNPKVTAASYGDVILVAHVGVTPEDGRYYEVAQVTPKTMEEKIIYHFTDNSRSNYDGIYDIIYDDMIYEDFGGSPYGGRMSGKTMRKRACVRKKVITLSIVVGMIFWVASGVLLTVKEGVPSGTTPIVFAVVSGIAALTHEAPVLGDILCIVGTLVFHVILCCGGGMCGLPNWIGREMYICGLYTWITAFVIWDFTLYHEDIFIACLFYLAISGLILDHPVVQIMGMVSVVIGVVMICMSPFSGWFLDALAEGCFPILIGAGMIAIGNGFSKSRECMAAFCHPFARVVGAIYHGQRNGPASTTQP